MRGARVLCMCRRSAQKFLGGSSGARSHLSARRVVKVLLSLSASILRLFRKRRGLRHGARLRRVPLAVEIRARSLERLGNSFRSARRTERRRTARKDAERRTERVPSWLLVGGEAVASLSRPPRVFLSWCPTSDRRSARSYDPRMATPIYDRSSRSKVARLEIRKECEHNANVRLHEGTFP